MYAQSKDGDKWSRPAVIFPPANEDNISQVPAGATPVATIDGKLFISWSAGKKLLLDRSYNKGETWLRNDILVSNRQTEWLLTVADSPKVPGLPVMVVDDSPSRFNGSIGIVWTDQQADSGADVWFIRTVNFGDYWTQAVRIGNGSFDKDQFLPAICIDQATGFLYVLFFDRSQYDDLRTDLCLASSPDGGATFKVRKLSEGFYLPDAGATFSNTYSTLDAYRDMISVAWAQVEGDGIALRSMVIKRSDLDKKATEKE